MVWFWKKAEKKQAKADQTSVSLRPIRIVISGATNGMPVQTKDVLQNSLSQISFLSLSYEEAIVFENFAEIDHRNFFDFWDKGTDILKRHRADVLLRYDQMQNQIRLSFQSDDMYQKKDAVFFSAAHNLFLPLSFFNEEILPPQISALILATIISFVYEKDEKYKIYLEQIMTHLGQQKIPAGIEALYMPNLLIFLVLCYLTFKKESFCKEDMALVLSLIKSAQKYLIEAPNSNMKAIIDLTLGQMYLCASYSKKADVYIFIRRAIEYFKKSLKIFSRYTYPYDYARISFVMAEQYIRMFQLSDDNQALRDAVAELRGAEQIFTYTIKPFLWAEIEEKLGFCFSVLSSKSNSEEIALMAVKHFKEKQKVYEREKYQKIWADTEKNIGDVYFYLGKHIKSENYLEKAIDSYNSAFEIYKNSDMKDETNLLEKCVLRADEEIMRLF